MKIVSKLTVDDNGTIKEFEDSVEAPQPTPQAVWQIMKNVADKVVGEQPQPKKKILILTASPIRDRLIDELLSDELTKKGHTVWVRPCLREGRQAILTLQPDVVVVPPIKNPFSRDFVAQIKKWGMGVVTRHTEPSCDWQDFKAMSQGEKAEILGAMFPYTVDLELVWSSDEAQILNNRQTPFRAFPVGSLMLDAYFKDDIKARYGPREKFNAKYGFDNTKKNLLIASPWGFADSAPDLRIDVMEASQKETEYKQIHLDMVKKLKGGLPDYNILVTLHPGVDITSYEASLKGVVPIDVSSCALELLTNADCLIHGGSTMAIEAHICGIPAFQFQDQNALARANWFFSKEADISKVSPNFGKDDVGKLIEAIKTSEKKSNADEVIIKKLVEGRYGIMDGKATERAATFINQVNGKFTLSWPESPNDYSRDGVLRSLDSKYLMQNCGICSKTFFMDKEFKGDFCCPWCGSKIIRITSNVQSDSYRARSDWKPAITAKDPT